MTDSSSMSPLIQRLAITRLAAPGCISRDQLQQTHEKFSNPPGARVFDRLFRRMEFGEPSATGLLFARTDSSLEPGATLGNTGSFVGNRLSRQSAGVTQAGAFVARKVAATPAVIASDRVVQRLVARAGDRSPPAISHERPVDVAAATPRSPSEQTSNERSSTHMSGSPAPSAAGSITPARSKQLTVMRKAESNVMSATRAAGPITAAPANLQPAMRKAEPAVVTATTSHTRASIAGSSQPIADAPTNMLADVRPPAIAQRPLATTLQRRAEETIVRAVESRPQSTAAADDLVLASKWSNVSPTDAGTTNAANATSVTIASIGARAVNAPAPLVLRKADVAAGSPAAAKQAPTISTSAPAVIAREVAATPRSPTNENESAQVGQSASLEIDRIVEQVESRLARRFEIERERQGVRPWHREN